MAILFIVVLNDTKNKLFGLWSVKVLLHEEILISYNVHCSDEESIAREAVGHMFHAASFLV